MGRKCYIGRGYVYIKKRKREQPMSFYPLFTLEKINIIYGKNLVNILLVRIRREGTAPAAKRLVSSLAN